MKKIKKTAPKTTRTGAKSPTDSPGFKTLNTADLERLRSFQIHDELIAKAGIKRVDDVGARRAGFSFRGNLSGRVYPYMDENGEEFNARLRRDNPEIGSAGKPENKYISRSKARRGLYWPPGAIEALKDLDAVGVIVEAETSALAGMAWAKRTGRNLAFVATGGCYGWRDKESGELADLARFHGRRVVLIFDSNVATNEKVQKAEFELAAHLSIHIKASSVSCCRLPQHLNGPDDFLASYSDKDFTRLMDSAFEPWLDRVGESYEAYESAKLPTFVIHHFLQSEGATIISGLAGHFKTFIVLSMMLSLLSGNQLFGYFDVLDKAKRVIYLTPEITLGSFKKRAEMFGLRQYIKTRQLLVRTLSAYPSISLDDPALLMAAKGADIFLDPLVRFMEGDESSATDNDRGLAAGIFGLLNAGARSVTCTHHSPKGFEKATYMALETVLRGTGDIGAMASVAWGVRMLDRGKALVYVANLKARDFEFPVAFQIAGEPYIAEGHGLQMAVRPEECGQLSEYLTNKSGRPRSPEKARRLAAIAELLDKGLTPEQIHESLEMEGFRVPKASTLKTEISKVRQATRIDSNASPKKQKWVANTPAGTR
jgi:hypothetical protein